MKFPTKQDKGLILTK